MQTATAGAKPFHADKVQAAIESDAAARTAHVASWRRSANLHHLDPGHRKAPLRLTQGEFNDARRRIEPLLKAAQSSLDRLYLAVGGVGCCVMLADRDGVPSIAAAHPATTGSFWTGVCGPAMSGVKTPKAPTASAPAWSSSAR